MSSVIYQQWQRCGKYVREGAPQHREIPARDIPVQNENDKENASSVKN